MVFRLANNNFLILSLSLSLPQERVSQRSLMLHYGCEHNVSLELYAKKTKDEDAEKRRKEGSNTVETVVDTAENKDPVPPAYSSSSSDVEIVAIGGVHRRTERNSLSATSSFCEGEKRKDSSEKRSRPKEVVSLSKALGSPSPPNSHHAQVQKSSHLPKPEEGGSKGACQASEGHKGPSAAKLRREDKTRRAPPGKLVELDMFSAANKSPPLSSKRSHRESALSCTKCKGKKTFVTQKSMNYHLVLTHYLPHLGNNSGPTFGCLMCSESFQEKTTFVKHFIADHLDEFVRLSKEGKEPRKRGFNKPRESRELARDSKNKDQEKDRKEDARKVAEAAGGGKGGGGEKEVAERGARKKTSRVSRRDVEAHSLEAPIPQSRVRHTVHVVGGGDGGGGGSGGGDGGTAAGVEGASSGGGGSLMTARQRLMKKWENTSLDGHRHRIEELEAK